MSTFVFVLLVSGVLLLGLEVVVPGAILGLVGGFFLLGAVVLSFMEGGRGSGFLTLGIALAAVGGLLWFEFRVLPRTKWGRRMFLDKAVAGTSQAPIATEADGVIGQEATALTALAPSGLVSVAGRRYEARCESGFVEAGAKLRVRRVETFHLVVIALD